MSTRKAYRTQRPWEDGGLSPVTDKTRAVPMFGGTPLISDIISGGEDKRPSDVHSRGSWAMDQDSDVQKNYREDSDDFMLRSRLRQMDKERAFLGRPKDKQIWLAEMEDGTILEFPNQETAIRTVNRKPYRRIFQKTAQSLPKTSIIEKSIESCGVIESTGLDGRTELGAGFCVGRNVFMTCAHVIGKYDKRSSSSNIGENFEIVVKSKTSEHPGTLLSIDYSKDIALVRTELDVPILKIVPSNPVKVGEEVFAIGNPRGFESNVTSGIVSGKDRKVFGYAGAPLYMFTDASVLPGNSGGPLLMYDTGEVVGMMALIVGANTGLYGLNAAVPGEYLLAFLKDNAF